ncbi:hypothetical protein DFQ27_000231 [Actinomortierella ambigua]|uniref:RING-type E3 ubiquitin transferase n=1 Tax=Actinomortierella ambigua TaxID=1343610 RepID=A0A9P6QGV9_9FUNG|nr:hypothetical protein DFQ27_000231 [Actinomortierella ambigua]
MNVVLQGSSTTVVLLRRPGPAPTDAGIFDVVWALNASPPDDRFLVALDVCAAVPQELMTGMRTRRNRLRASISSANSQEARMRKQREAVANLRAFLHQRGWRAREEVENVALAAYLCQGKPPVVKEGSLPIGAEPPLPKSEHPRNHPRPAPRETPEERSVAEQQRSALEKRVHIYRHGLYVKHMGANRISRYQQTTPETFQIFPARLDRLAPWIRRELQAITWLLTTRGIASGQNVPSPSSSSSSSPSLGSVADDDGLLRDEVAPGLEVVREYILAVMKQYDLQTDPAMDLLQGFLHEYTEHFVHELMAYARSPFSIEAYDQAAQYSSATAASQQSRGSPTPSFQRQSRSCDSTRLSFRDGDGGRGKRRRDSTAGEERMESRQNRHGKSVRRGGRDDVDGGAAQDNSEKGKAEGIATSSRIPRDDGHSSGLPSCTIASSSSSKPQLSSSEQMQRLIREKLAREKAIYDKNHPS